MRKVNSFKDVDTDDIVYIEKRQSVHRVTYLEHGRLSFTVIPRFIDNLERSSCHVIKQDLILDFYILDTPEELTMYELGASNFDLCKSK